ncbi:NAD(P) transhydrogenase mitochondrial [Bienertia sinuspersici]
MKALAWNCRGARTEDSLTIQYIRDLVAKTNPNFLFLSETKCSCQSLESFARRLGSGICTGVDGSDLSGGLFLALFNSSFSMNVLRKTKNFILCIINEADLKYLVCFLYGASYVEEREAVWTSLSEAICLVNLPTVILGDFNQVEFHDQKWGGSRYIPGATAFSNWRVNLSLPELPFHGPRFTWCNNREKGGLIYERLDRGIANNSWRSENRCKKRPYKLEAWCLNHEEVQNIIDVNWKTNFSGSKMFVLQRKQQLISRACRDWCVQYKKYHGITWDSLRERLLPLQSDPDSGLPVEGEIVERHHCSKVAEDQLLFWKQRARLKWDLEGDECTKLFFKCVKTRKGRNQIKCLKNEENEWCHDEDQISFLFFHHFKSLYNPTVDNTPHFEEDSWKGEKVSHLFFTDDALFFFKATPDSCKVLRETRDEENQGWVTLIATLWAIWLHRNEIIFNNRAIDPIHILHIARMEETRWHRVFNQYSQWATRKYAKRMTDILEQTNGMVEWRWGVQEGTVSNLIIVDGAWKEDLRSRKRSAAIGWVLEENGDTMVSGSGKVCTKSSLQTECYAILKGIEAAVGT